MSEKKPAQKLSLNKDTLKNLKKTNVKAGATGHCASGGGACTVTCCGGVTCDNGMTSL
jgi:hypothetical protein